MTLPGTATIAGSVTDALAACGVAPDRIGGDFATRTPITGGALPGATGDDAASIDDKISRAAAAFPAWRDTPAPVRGNLIKRWGELLTEHKADLARIVTAEAGKITSEALGEVQEMIDICDLAVGQSRQLYGKTMPSERPGHRLMETWHPLGVVGIISAFNFPAAVWAWNTALALVCGNTVVWKPSELTSLTALAADALLGKAVAEVGAPADLHHVIVSDRAGGERLVDDPRVALVSATGSVRMGREVGPRVAARFGKLLLELGGNNAAIVTPSADLDLAVRGIVFAAAGTAGQRCTSMRRLIVHSSIADELVGRITAAYGTLAIGDPEAEGTLVGPLINEKAFEGMRRALDEAQAQGGKVRAGGERVLADEAPEAYYVEPAVVSMPGQEAIVTEETFAPILYVMTYDDIEDAIAMNNAVPQGLSAAIFTGDQAEAELFVSSAGSDTGIANVNIGTSGAEIGGAFGGEKETGGGRESGSDSWQSYMRPATNTVNYSGQLPLAQGVEFV
ncbi:L-piperidine-6-carboxylate dehydrogenase [Naumannella cuiyingiana]|uniref:aldehyde dehydrogenase (NAD(+)) n=1 Tax=Naumannella cuiyingiana TaxID=1347891 RepID=A0A7Z0D631_9ACTN|nr:aldehyde dehydrogenase family protein [Naumannella cuiyingiana]NYI69548.1 aldehyde dehydrogenase (NAD+) [Naumannella cuiyingiana]